MATQPTELLLSEEVFLVMLPEHAEQKPAGIPWSADAGLAGALIGELFLAGRFNPDAAGKIIADPTPTGDQLIDESLATIAGSRRRRSVEDWVYNLAKTHPQYRVAERLAARGLVVPSKHHVLGVFWEEERYLILNGAARHEILVRLRGVVLGGIAPDVRTWILLSVLYGCKHERDLGFAASHMKEIVGKDMLAVAVRSAFTRVANESSG